MKPQTITHSGKKHQYPVQNGKVEIPEKEITDILNEVKLLLYFFAACGLFYLEKRTFTAIARAVGKWVDRTAGGLSAEGQQTFGNDEEVLAAANQHIAHLAAKGKAPTNRPVANQIKVAPSSPLPETTTEKKSPMIPESLDEPGNLSSMAAIWIPVEKLIENPLNATIYDNVLNPALRASVEEHGIKVPIRIIRDYLIVDGHQRFWAAKEAGYKLVPVIFVETAEDQLELLLEYNRHREKTLTERLREYRAYLQVEKSKAAERAGTRTDLGQNLPPGQAPGKSRDIAALKVGLSGSTAETGLRVLEEVEKREKSGEPAEVVAKVKQALNKSIHGSGKLAQQLGWLDSAVKPPRKKPAKTDADASSVSQAHKSSSDDHVSSQSETASSQAAAVSGWLTDELIVEASSTEKLEPDEIKELNSTVRRIRPALYLEMGTAPTTKTSSQLRHLAQSLLQLAAKIEEANQ